MSFQVYGNDESCLLNAIKVYQIAVEVRAPRIASQLCVEVALVGICLLWPRPLLG